MLAIPDHPSFPPAVPAPWQVEAYDRLARLFPGGMHPMVQALAFAHPYAVQYLEQAPALVAFVLRGQRASDIKSLIHINEWFKAKVAGGPRLKALLADLGMPLPLRAIRGTACSPSLLPAIYFLGSFPPAVLGQCIPTRTRAQQAWLRAVLLVLQKRTDTYMNAAWKNGFVEWAVPTFGRAIVEFSGETPENMLEALGVTQVGELAEHVARPLLDFNYRNSAAFNPKWTLRQARAAAERWHEELRRRTTEAEHLKRYGFSMAHRFDYGVIPDEIEMEGFTFHALRSGQELFEEGLAMRHCVAAYSGVVASGRSFIVSMRLDGRRVATIELLGIGPPRRLAIWDKPMTLREYLERDLTEPVDVRSIATRELQLGQIQGPCNAPVHPRIRAAANYYGTTMRDWSLRGPDDRADTRPFRMSA